MCGLIGFSGKSNYHTKTLQMLLVWNSLERGEDSTGIYTPQNGCIKKLTKGSHFVLYPENHFSPDNLFIGHVRAATIGVKNVENAHPFEKTDYVLAHNGTLKNHTDLAKLYDVNTTIHTVDSDIIAECIQKEGNISRIIQKINGAAAFLIHDKNDPEVLYAFSNGERTLYRGVDKNNNIYISSIAEPLLFANLSKVKEFKHNVLYTIRNGVIENTKRIKNIPYSHPIPITTYNSYNSTSQKEDDWKDLRIRCNHTTTIVNPKIANFNIDMVKDKYYICDGTADNQYHVRIKYYTSDKCFYLLPVPKSLFNQRDIIKVGDLVRPLEPTTFWDTSQGKNVTIDKSEPLRVTKLWNDGDLTVVPLLHRFISVCSLPYRRKYLYEKISAEESIQLLLEEENYLKNDSIKDVQIDEDSVDDTNAVGIITDKTPIVTKSHTCEVPKTKQESINYDIETEVDVDTPKDKIPVDQEDLEEMFIDIESQLTNLNTEMSDLDYHSMERSLIALDYSLNQWKIKILP